MKKIIIYFFILFNIIGCCSAGLQQFSDGNWYYPNWCEYDTCYHNSGSVDCYKKDKYITSLYPLSPEEVQYYMHMKMLEAQQALMIQQQQNMINQQMNMQTQQLLNQVNQNTQNINNYNQQLHNYNNNFLNQYDNDNSINTNCIGLGNMVNCKSC